MNNLIEKIHAKSDQIMEDFEDTIDGEVDPVVLDKPSVDVPVKGLYRISSNAFQLRFFNEVPFSVGDFSQSLTMFLEEQRRIIGLQFLLNAEQLKPGESVTVKTEPLSITVSMKPYPEGEK